jgi:flagellar biosynthesis/type III secretory pathway M-ring protein FliF/YscJ
MDWQQRSIESLRRPQSIALLVGAIAMVGLVAIQTNSLNPAKPPMCELISKCQLRHGDLQRIQVALGEAGLTDFEIDGHKLLVPQSRHSEYMQAVSERDALPMDLREDRSDSFSNPLLSRSQQQAVKWQRKKRQLKEMILRLPFVQQAWLEIDSAPAASPFQSARQSAVVSIQPSGDQPLAVNHVNTLRRMISGAVAGLAADQIEVIDLGEGFAYDHAGGLPVVSAASQLQHQNTRVQQLEQQIKSALNRFDGVSVNVRLSACSHPVQPTVRSNQPLQRLPRHLTAGSNGVASIFSDTHSTTSAAPASQAGHSKAAAEDERSMADSSACRVAVHVNVPESALKNVAMSLLLRRPGTDVDPVQQKFGIVRSQIEREVASLLPAEWVSASGPSPVEVTLQRSASAAASSQQAQLMNLFQKYWPSAATLCVGVILLFMMSRKSFVETQDNSATPDVISLARHRDVSSNAAKNAKESINQMFRDDPDKAAAAIEGWIKKAG